MIDGGVTHADAVGRWRSSSAARCPIFGMVKDDRHRTGRWVTPEGREIGIVNDQAVFSLIGQIQEETHRFAITYHHQLSYQERHTALRAGRRSRSGTKKRQAELRKHFGTVKAIREADETALAAVLPQNGPYPLDRDSVKGIHLKKTSSLPHGKGAHSAIRRIRPACRLFS